MAAKKKGLGRGLDALFADVAPVYYDEEGGSAKDILSGMTGNKEQEIRAEGDSAAAADDQDRIIYVDINDIKPNPAQPRKHFDEAKLNDLAASIRENGVIQPLVVRKADKGYELVAGERRWRASRIAGLRHVPCIVRDFDEKQNMIVAILENMQREDLDPIEEALGLKAMSDTFGFTQEQISTSLGKSRAYIANSLRLLKLPEWIREMISSGEISAAHGRTIINVNDEKKQRDICRKIVMEGLSVRATEKLADKAKDDLKPERKKRKPKEKKRSDDVAAVEAELKTKLGTKVTIVENGTSGKIEIEYYSVEELNRLIEGLREGF